MVAFNSGRESRVRQRRRRAMPLTGSARAANFSEQVWGDLCEHDQSRAENPNRRTPPGREAFADIAPPGPGADLARGRARDGPGGHQGSAPSLEAFAAPGELAAAQDGRDGHGPPERQRTGEVRSFSLEEEAHRERVSLKRKVDSLRAPQP